MRVLIACECSGAVRDAFLAAGVDAWSCDIKPTEAPGPHIQGDAIKVLTWGWDLMICHPECRYLSSSGLFRNIGNPVRQAKTEAALAFAMALWNAPIPFIAMENQSGASALRSAGRNRPCSRTSSGMTRASGPASG